MEELNRTLASLEKRLMDLEQDDAPDMRDILRPEQEPVRASARPSDEMVTNLAEIAENLRRMRDSQEQPRQHHIQGEGFESRIEELVEQVSTTVMQRSSDALYRKLGELSSRIDELASGSALPSGVVDQLAQQVNLLARQVGKVLENLSQSDYRAMEERLEAIGEKLEAAERRTQEPHPLVLDTIDRRFAELAERLDAHYAARHVDSGTIHSLEGRLDDLSQQISLGFLQAPIQDGPSIDSKAIRSLEDQIANIARHLAQPAAELAELKPRLDSIERSIASNRETVLDAAREAAESAVAHVLQHGSHGDSVIARQLAEDMKSLEALARSSEERNGKTFETVHDTLTKIVDRLARIEQDVAGRPKAPDAMDAPNAAGKSRPFANPDTVSPRPLTPRSPAAAAAEAAFATVQSEAARADAGAGETGRPSPFRSFAKTIRGRRADKLEDENGQRLAANGTDAPSDALALEGDLAIEPITRREPELERNPVPRPQGEDMPDLNSIMKRVREERRHRENTAEAALAAAGKVDFITAARRAAQLAATESEQLQKGATAQTDRKKSSFSAIIKRQRKPILMAIGAVMIAMAGLQIGSAFLDRDEQTGSVIDAVPEKSETPVVEAPAAPIDDIAAKIASTTTPAPQEPATPAPSPAEPEAEPLTTAGIPAKAEPQEPAPETNAGAETAAQPAIPTIPEEAGPAALREAAAKGDARALFEIGNRYTEGRGVAAEFAKAADWYRIAADQGFAPAQYRLGNFNEKGLGMARDLDKAKTWYQLSAQQGNASAMHNLAVLFATGANGAPDNASAVRWFTDAAELGVKDSQFNLGILAAKGLGMPVNLEESYKWFALAANAGDKDAADKRDEIAKALKPEQLARARDMVTLWKAKPLDQAVNSIDVPDAWTEDKPMPTGSVDMKKAVRNIQLILQKNGYDVGSADGLMGGKTRTAIAAFQKANGQQPTGDVDQKLVQLLLEKNK
nr:SEL1-like repeat protein [Brucella daejeonensis]